MSFQLPKSTTAPTGTGFSFGLTQTNATAGAPPKFSFGSPANIGAGGGGGASALGQLAAAASGIATTATGAAATPSLLSLPKTAPTQIGQQQQQLQQQQQQLQQQQQQQQLQQQQQQQQLPTLGQNTNVLSLGLGAGIGGGLSAPTSSATGGGFANLSTATKTTDSAVTATNLNSNSSTHVSYNQLEEYINKWTLELEEQEKIFTDQATQINAWDKILINNNEKILELNDAVQKVKADQQTLESELEFINTQHKELEDSITPLYKELMSIPQIDVERSQTYLLVENLDTQLKQMSEDLKEIIDNLNEANKGQDTTDPIIQIGKILNAHMSSLQWIDSTTSNLGNKLDELDKMHETYKRDTERSFRTAYYN